MSQLVGKSEDRFSRVVAHICIERHFWVVVCNRGMAELNENMVAVQWKGIINPTFISLEHCWKLYRERFTKINPEYTLYWFGNSTEGM